MSRPISHDPSHAHRQEIGDLYNTRNDVPVTPCTVISAIVKKIADLVTALFQYLASFFTDSTSHSTPQSATTAINATPTTSQNGDIYREAEEFLFNLFDRHHYTPNDFREAHRSELLPGLARKIVHDLVMDPKLNQARIPFFADVHLGPYKEYSIRALNTSFDELKDIDRTYVKSLFASNLVTPFSHYHPLEIFLQQANMCSLLLSEHDGFVSCVSRAMINFAILRG